MDVDLFLVFISFHLSLFLLSYPFTFDFFILSFFLTYLIAEFREPPRRIKCYVNLLEECIICYDKPLVIVEFECCKCKVCNFCFKDIHKCPICRKHF